MTGRIGTDPRFAPSAAHGAALRYLLERVDIERCATPAALSEIMAVVERTRAWSRAQPLEIHLAYTWACDKVTDDARGRLAIFENARRVSDAYAELPKPPDPTPP